MAASAAAIFPISPQVRAADENSWTGPEFGLEVTWDGDWFLPDTEVYSEESAGEITEEWIILRQTRESFGLELRSADLERLEWHSAEAFFDGWVAQRAFNPDVIADLLGINSEVRVLLEEYSDLSATGLFTYELDNERVEKTCVQLRQFLVSSDEKLLSYVTLFANADDFEDALRDSQELVTRDGKKPFQDIDIDDLMDLVNDDLSDSEDDEKGKDKDFDPDKD